MSESLLASFGTMKDDTPTTPTFVFPTLKTTTGTGTVSSYDGLTLNVPATAFCALIGCPDETFMIYGDGVSTKSYSELFTGTLTATRLRVTGRNSSIIVSYYILSLS